ncbi:hypothetical protein FRC07_006669 [Ceratobasidium sp. 392]|nr:hypothetical protein FRC07_006669 [Ceratobasidium sp. 392]
MTGEKSGNKEDPKVKAWLAKIKTEADDLKQKTFGVELLQPIGAIYSMKSNSALKSHEFLGILGFISRLKEKGPVVKEALGVFSSAVGVQRAMDKMTQLQERGGAAEAEPRVLERNLTGKRLLACWRITRWEVIRVLQKVCDKVLEERGASKQDLSIALPALFLIGELLKKIKPDGSGEERSELERLVAEASILK